MLALVNAAALDIHIVLYRGHLELEKGKRWPALLKAPTGPENTLISLQKSYNGCKHNNKVALLLGELQRM